jgi:hypothetical protein
VSNGDSVAQRFPNNAWAIARPTQNHAYTTIGPIVSVSLARRAEAIATTMKNKSIKLRIVHSRPRLVSTDWIQDGRADGVGRPSKRGSVQRVESATNETINAVPAPKTKRHRGTGRSVRPPIPWANAGVAVTRNVARSPAKVADRRVRA